MSYFITHRVTPLYNQYYNEPAICVAFDNSHVQYISDTLHIIRSVFNPQFILLPNMQNMHFFCCSVYMCIYALLFKSLKILKCSINPYHSKSFEIDL